MHWSFQFSISCFCQKSFVFMKSMEYLCQKLWKNEVLFIKHLHRNQKKYSQYFSAIFIKSINRYLAHVKRVEIWSVFERTRTITYRYFEWHFWNWRDRRHIEVRIKKQTTFCFHNTVAKIKRSHDITSFVQVQNQNRWAARVLIKNLFGTRDKLSKFGSNGR